MHNKLIDARENGVKVLLDIFFWSFRVVLFENMLILKCFIFNHNLFPFHFFLKHFTTFYLHQTIAFIRMNTRTVGTELFDLLSRRHSGSDWLTVCWKPSNIQHRTKHCTSSANKYSSAVSFPILLVDVCL